MRAVEKDVVAVLRLFEYMQTELRRLGFSDAADLFDTPLESFINEVQARFGAGFLEDDDAPGTPPDSAH